MTTRGRLSLRNTTRGARLAGTAIALAALLVAPGCSGGAERGATDEPEGGSASATAATDHLQVEKGHLAWGELRLGMTVREAENKLGRGFGFTRSTGGCKGFTAPVMLHGHAVQVTFDSKDPDGELVGATVELAGGDLDTLLDAVRGRLPDLELVASDGDADEKPAPRFALAADPEQAVVADPAEALTIAFKDCLN